MTDTPPPGAAGPGRVLVLLNARAGTLARTQLQADEVGAEFARQGVDAEVASVAAAEFGERARAAVGAGARAVVAGGGDGTIGTVAAVLADSGVPLGVLPLGTRNHFARDLGLAVTLQQAVAVIAAGHARAIDVGDVNGRIFINNASLGLYPQIVQERDEHRLRFGWAKGLATAWATLNVLRRFWLMRVRVVVDGQTIVRTTPFVFVGNNEYSMHLFALGARSCLDAGSLSLYISHTTRRFGLLRLAVLALVDRLSQAEDFEQRCVSEAWLETPRRLARVALDGEVVPMIPPLHFRVRQGALRVLVHAPAPEPAAPA
jgi:diacylglycerol kinase family enzyme